MHHIYLVLNWAFGVLFFLLGVVILFDDPLSSIPLFVIAALLLPFVRQFVFKKTNLAFPAKVRAFSIFALFIIFGVLAGNSQEKKEQLLAQQQAKKQAAANEAIKKKKIDHFTTNKSSIMAEIQSDHDKSNYQQATAKAAKYLISKDPELINIHIQSKNMLAAKRKKEQTEQILKNLRSIPATDLEKNKNLYQQLASLHPDNKSYKVKYDAYLKKIQAQKEKQRIAAERKDQIENQFSAWDGSHRSLEKAIKSSMNDPSSYEHVKTVYWDKKSHLVVLTTFRGKNAFGALVKNSIKAKVDLSGSVLKILEQY
ncbi:MAG: hypothetical protein OEV42_19500 [Deltaproteobacteria bacterium]|nr:hypothetical protein [Deltaproteobacteria bacterium]